MSSRSVNMKDTLVAAAAGRTFVERLVLTVAAVEARGPGASRS